MSYKIEMVKYRNDQMKTYDLSKNLIDFPIIQAPLDESLGRCKFSLLLDTRQFGETPLFDSENALEVPRLNTSIDPYTRFFIAKTDKKGNVEEYNYLIEFDSVEKFILNDKGNSCKWIHHINLIDCSAMAQAILVPENSFIWRLQDTMLRYYGLLPQVGVTANSYDTQPYQDGEKFRTRWNTFNQILEGNGYHYSEYNAEIIVDKNANTGSNTIQNPVKIYPQTGNIQKQRYYIPKFDLAIGRFRLNTRQDRGGMAGSAYTAVGTVDNRYTMQLSTQTIVTMTHPEKPTITQTYYQYIPTNQNQGFNNARVNYTINSYDQAGNTIQEETWTPNGLIDNESNLYRSIYSNSNSSGVYTNSNGTAYLDLTIYDATNNIDLTGYTISIVTSPYLVRYSFSSSNDTATYTSSSNISISSFRRYFRGQNNYLGDIYSHPLINGVNNIQSTYNVQYSLNFDVRQDIDYNKTLYQSSAPYNILDVFTKIQISCGQILAQNYTNLRSVMNDLPFVWEGSLVDRNSAMFLADQTTVPEINFTQKSQWDVLVILGYFMGAIPKINAQKNSSQFVISLKKLGGTKETQYNTVMSIYNSRHMSEVVTEIKNLYQNVINSTTTVKEYIYPMSDDGSLVSIDNMKFRSTYKIDKLVKFGFYTDPTTMNNYVDATPWIVEESIYTQFNSIYNKGGGTIPNKGMMLFYKNGTNEIEGLSYVSPNMNTQTNLNEVHSAAIKNVIRAALVTRYDQSTVNGQPNGFYNNPFAFNPYDYTGLESFDITNYIFEIEYVAIADVQVSMLRTDLRKYFLNTEFNQYPTFQQRDQVQEYNIESHKLGANIAGNLMRQGNEIYQIETRGADLSKLHEPGEIYRLDNIYYINNVTTIFFPDHYEQKIELSKDFNRLSQFIGLDSQSRFYEIPNQKVNRVRPNNIIMEITTKEDGWTELGKYNIDPISQTAAVQFLLDIILRNPNAQYPNYAEVIFKTEGGEVYKGLLPIKVDTIGRALSMQVETKDNFKFGDAYMLSSYNDGNSNQVVYINDTRQRLRTTADGNGNSFYLMPTQCRMTDIYGQVKSYVINILKDYRMNAAQGSRTKADAFTLPAQTIEGVDYANNFVSVGKHNEPTQDMMLITLPEYLVFKDAGEKLTLPTIIQPVTGSDRFNLSQYLWQVINYSAYNPPRQRLSAKLFALNYELNKFDDAPIDLNNYIYKSPDGAVLASATAKQFNISQTMQMTPEQMSATKCIALVDMNTRIPIKYRNVGELEDRLKLSDWIFRFSL